MRLTIRQPLNLPWERIVSGFFPLLVVASFLFSSGYFVSLTCLRASYSAPVNCLLAQGNILGVETLTLNDVQNIGITRCGRGYECPLIQAANYETKVPLLEFNTVHEIANPYDVQRSVGPNTVVDDRRWLGALGIIGATAAAIGWVWYLLMDREWIAVSFDKQHDRVIVRHQYFLQRSKLEERRLSDITAIHCRKNHQYPEFAQIILISRGRDLSLWETLQAELIADRIRRFLDLSQ